MNIFAENVYDIYILYKDISDRLNALTDSFYAIFITLC